MLVPFLLPSLECNLNMNANAVCTYATSSRTLFLKGSLHILLLKCLPTTCATLLQFVILSELLNIRIDTVHVSTASEHLRIARCDAASLDIPSARPLHIAQDVVRHKKNWDKKSFCTRFVLFALHATSRKRFHTHCFDLRTQSACIVFIVHKGS